VKEALKEVVVTAATEETASPDSKAR